MEGGGTPVLDVLNVTRIYPGGKKAVDRISFQMQKGEVTGFLGPNGAGKTTTMRIITGFMAPTEGEVYVMGKRVEATSPEVRQYIGYLPENNPLYPDMTVLDYLEMAARIRGIAVREIPRRIRYVAEVCGIQEELTNRIAHLSRGYRQRVGLAQALLHDPPILILDEPTSGLDPIQTFQVRELIRELGKEKTILLSTHILPEAEAICSRILIIHQGRIVADGTPQTLREGQNAELSLTLDIPSEQKEPVIRILKQVEGVLGIQPLNDSPDTFLLTLVSEDRRIRRAIFEACVQGGFPVIEMHLRRRSLEDVFQELTGFDGSEESQSSSFKTSRA